MAVTAAVALVPPLVTQCHELHPDRGAPVPPHVTQCHALHVGHGSSVPALAMQ